MLLRCSFYTRGKKPGIINTVQYFPKMANINSLKSGLKLTTVNRSHQNVTV